MVLRTSANQLAAAVLACAKVACAAWTWIRTRSPA